MPIDTFSLFPLGEAVTTLRLDQYFESRTPNECRTLAVRIDTNGNRNCPNGDIDLVKALLAGREILWTHRRGRYDTDHGNEKHDA
jgi:hypothetical protein